MFYILLRIVITPSYQINDVNEQWRQLGILMLHGLLTDLYILTVTTFLPYNGSTGQCYYYWAYACQQMTARTLLYFQLIRYGKSDP